MCSRTVRKRCGGRPARQILNNCQSLSGSASMRLRGNRLCGRLVRDNGPVDLTTKKLETMLVDDSSPLASTTLFAIPDALQKNRAYGLTAFAAQWIRIDRRFKKDNSYFGLVAAFESDDAPLRYVRCCSKRLCCDDPWFLRRWKAGFYANDGGSVSSHNRDALKIGIGAAANGPMVCSIVRCEVLHGELNNMTRKRSWWSVAPEIDLRTSL